MGRGQKTHRLLRTARRLRGQVKRRVDGQDQLGGSRHSRSYNRDRDRGGVPVGESQRQMRVIMETGDLVVEPEAELSQRSGW